MTRTILAAVLVLDPTLAWSIWAATFAPALVACAVATCDGR